MSERTKGREAAEVEAEQLVEDAFATHARWILAQTRKDADESKHLAAHAGPHQRLHRALVDGMAGRRLLEMLEEMDARSLGSATIAAFLLETARILDEVQMPERAEGIREIAAAFRTALSPSTNAKVGDDGR